jgi:hypothetical protein
MIVRSEIRRGAGKCVGNFRISALGALRLADLVVGVRRQACQLRGRWCGPGPRDGYFPNYPTLRRRHLFLGFGPGDGLSPPALLPARLTSGLVGPQNSPIFRLAGTLRSAIFQEAIERTGRGGIRCWSVVPLRNGPLTGKLLTVGLSRVERGHAILVFADACGGPAAASRALPDRTNPRVPAISGA